MDRLNAIETLPPFLNHRVYWLLVFGFIALAIVVGGLVAIYFAMGRELAATAHYDQEQGATRTAEHAALMDAIKQAGERRR